MRIPDGTIGDGRATCGAGLAVDRLFLLGGREGCLVGAQGGIVAAQRDWSVTSCACASVTAGCRKPCRCQLVSAWPTDCVPVVWSFFNWDPAWARVWPPVVWSVFSWASAWATVCAPVSGQPSTGLSLGHRLRPGGLVVFNWDCAWARVWPPVVWSVFSWAASWATVWAPVVWSVSAGPGPGPPSGRSRSCRC